MSETKEPKSGTKGYESADANFKWLLVSILSLMGLLLVAMVVIYGVHLFFETTQDTPARQPSALALERELPPMPRLQANPNRDWADFEASQDSIISSTGWISREAGVARIPIETAMEIMLERGYPVRPQANVNRGVEK